MLNNYIVNKYLNTRKLNLKFIKNKPFSYLVLEGFFKDNFISDVTSELLNEKFVFQESDLFSFKQTNDLLLSKNDKIKEFYNLINSKEFKEYLFNITGIKAFGKIDSSCFIYSNGDYLLPHDDRLEKRKIAYVLNLSKNFTKLDCGSLDFFSANKIVKSIYPKFNTLTIFKVITGKTFHQVSEVLSDKKRISIAGWFNDK